MKLVTIKGNKRENESFTNAKMRKENLDPPLNQERGKLIYDPGSVETFNATFFFNYYFYFILMDWSNCSVVR